MSWKRSCTISAASLPDFCFAVLPRTPKQLIIVKHGVDGYFPYSDPCTSEEAAAELADHFNAGLGVVPAQRSAMVNGALFSWEVPAARLDAPINQTARLLYDELLSYREERASSSS